MTCMEKLILIALAAVGLVFLAVGFTLMHYIGGFMRTVEEEALEEAEAGETPPEAPKALE